MAIDHDSPFKELRPKDRRRTSMGDGRPEPEEEEEVEEDEKSAEVEEDEESAEVEEDEESAEVEEQEQVASADGGERWPRWLRPMMSARFYTPCKTHPGSRRGSVRAMFCLDCAAAGALCSLCADRDHGGHHVIRVRRSTYSSVLLVSDVRGLLDVDGVQTYVINGARVVFLRERGPQQKHARHASSFVNHCGCGRGLSDAFRFCSLSCKFPRCCHDRNACPPSSPQRNAADQTSPPPPPPAHRRKGIPYRAPFGNLVV